MLQSMRSKRVGHNLMTEHNNITSIILNGEKLKAFPSRSEIRQESYFYLHSFGSPSPGNQRKKEIKGIQTGKEVKLLLFASDMIL